MRAISPSATATPSALAARDRPMDLSVSWVARSVPAHGASRTLLRGEQRAFDLHEMHVGRDRDAAHLSSRRHAFADGIDLPRAAELLRRQRRRVGAADRERRRRPPSPSTRSRPSNAAPCRPRCPRHHKADLLDLLLRHVAREALPERHRRVTAVKSLTQPLPSVFPSTAITAPGSMAPALIARRCRSHRRAKRLICDVPVRQACVVLQQQCACGSKCCAIARSSAGMAAASGAPLSCPHASRPALRPRAPGRSAPMIFPSFATVRPATINSFTCCAVARPSRSSIRIEVVAQAVVVDRGPGEQQEIGRRPRRDDAAVIHIHHRETAIAETDFEHLLAARRHLEPSAGMKQMGEPQLAQPVVILSSALPSTPSATRQPFSSIAGIGATPDRKCRFEELLTTMVTPRSASNSSSAGRAQTQCANVRRGDRSPMRSRYFHHAIGIGLIHKAALIARFQKMHVNAPPGALRRFGHRFEQRVAAPLRTVRPVLHVKGRARGGIRDRIGERDVFRGRERFAQEFLLDLDAGRFGNAARTAQKGRKPADCGPSSTPRNRRARRHPSRRARPLSLRSANQ